MEKYDVVLGLDWLKTNKPHINWDSSILSIKHNEVTHYMFLKYANVLLCEHVFVQIIEAHEDLKKYVNFKIVNLILSIIKLMKSNK